MLQDELARAVKVALKPDAPLAAGDWCKWCRAKPICPAQKKLFADLIDIKMHPDWSPAQLADILEKSKQVEKLIKDVEERAKHELANGRTVPGWRLKAGATRLAWSMGAKDTIAALRGLGLKGDKAIQPITPAAAKTALFDQMSEEHIAYMLSKIPMNRFVGVGEIAAMVAWLSSEECSFSTGAVFDLSGGRATY